MLRSLFSAVTGLRSHQTRMDVIGHNLANVNSIAYKSARASFRELFSQTLRGATAPAPPRGGINPQQVGLGTAIGSVDTLQEQGALQATGRVRDLAIEGNGFFVLAAGAEIFYSRTGNFVQDATGTLVDPSTGLNLQTTTGTNITVPAAVVYISIDRSGNVTGVDAAGTVLALGQVALASFANPEGLTRAGNNLYSVSPNSGAAAVGAPQTGGRGAVVSGSLEMSNVDLAKEFSDMIVTQRGFQANTRMVSVSDEMLQELANLRR
ncbi:MAG TPA: flagellar basal body rod protein FlgG [Clostridiales bacterium]|nr:flagellar basal body rod protein FlgG [Clostridiales bacterium]